MSNLRHRANKERRSRRVAPGGSHRVAVGRVNGKDARAPTRLFTSCWRRAGLPRTRNRSSLISFSKRNLQAYGAVFIAQFCLPNPLHSPQSSFSLHYCWCADPSLKLPAELSSDPGVVAETITLPPVPATILSILSADTGEATAVGRYAR